MIYTKKCSYPVYTFVLDRFCGSNIVCQVEASSKTEAIDYFLDVYRINIGTIGACKGYYFDKNGEVKNIDMLGAFKRRKGMSHNRGE